jgi:hypothetical protein
MLHHHTTDPSDRALDIAERDAEEVWRNSHSWDQWYKTLVAVYEQALQEFLPQL